MNEVTSPCKQCLPASGGRESESKSAAQVTPIPGIYITHVLFDLDGTILDTEAVYNMVYGEMVKKFGKEYSTSVRIRHVGTPDADTAKIICDALDLPISWEEFLKQSQIQLKERLGRCNLMPGLERLVRHFSKHGIPIAIATSSTQESMELKLSQYQEIKSLFNHIVAGGTDPEVQSPKPAPDVFLVAASRFPKKPPPSEVLVFEDSVSGVGGAVAAKMNVVATPDPIVPREMLSGATIILKTLLDFRPEMFGLPPF